MLDYYFNEFQTNFYYIECIFTTVETTCDEILVAFDLIIVNNTIRRVDAAISGFSDLMSNNNDSIIHQETVDSVSKRERLQGTIDSFSSQESPNKPVILGCSLLKATQRSQSFSTLSNIILSADDTTLISTSSSGSKSSSSSSSSSPSSSSADASSTPLSTEICQTQDTLGSLIYSSLISDLHDRQIKNATAIKHFYIIFLGGYKDMHFENTGEGPADTKPNPKKVFYILFLQVLKFYLLDNIIFILGYQR